MKIKILKQLQEYIYDLYDNKGNLRDKPIGIIGNARTLESNLKYLKDIITVFMATDKLSESTKIFISNHKVSIKSANEILNDIRVSTKRCISYNKTVASINKDEQELINCIGEDFLKDIVYNNIPDNLQLNKKVNKLIKRYSIYTKQRDNLILDIDDKYVECTKYKGNEEFFNKLRLLEPYIIYKKIQVEKEINKDKEFIGYFNYLLSTIDIGDEQINKDRERLIKFLSSSVYTNKLGDESSSKENNIGDEPSSKRDNIDDEQSSKENNIETEVVELDAINNNGDSKKELIKTDNIDFDIDIDFDIKDNNVKNEEEEDKDFNLDINNIGNVRIDNNIKDANVKKEGKDNIDFNIDINNIGNVRIDNNIKDNNVKKEEKDNIDFNVDKDNIDFNIDKDNIDFSINEDNLGNVRIDNNIKDNNVKIEIEVEEIEIEPIEDYESEYIKRVKDKFNIV